MDSLCKKCGNIANGETYTFHHGLKTGEAVQRAGAMGDHQIRTSRYSGIGATSYFLCDNCISQRVKRNLLIGLIGGIVFALLGIFLFVVPLQVNGKPLLSGLGLCGFPIAFVLFIYGLLALRRKITGEDLAIEIGQKEIKTADTFWNSEDYQKLS